VKATVQRRGPQTRSLDCSVSEFDGKMIDAVWVGSKQMNKELSFNVGDGLKVVEQRWKRVAC
jgi:hypothetical protein